MLGHEIENHKQLTEIRRKIDANLQEKVVLKSLYYCGSKVAIKDLPGVALVRNNVTADFYGVTHCKSSWCCPVCTPRRMSAYALDIACGIDALKAQGQLAAMITFTIPHTSGFSCKQATEILYNVWKGFTVHGNKVGKGIPKNDVFANFALTHDHKHRVRVTEYTYGENGWHPHFHCLFWFPKEKFNDIVNWEERLQTRWLELCKRYTIREILKSYPEQTPEIKKRVETRVKIMYEKFEGGSDCVHISKNNDGSARAQQSSQYICGWGADKELTGNFEEKATKNGHFTWQQILQMAINEDREIKINLNELETAEGSRKAEVSIERAAQVQANIENTLNQWWKLYFEYAHATRRHARVNFSVHSGLKKIIAEWKKTNEYQTVAKKNLQSREQKFGKWVTICWFLKDDWSEICYKHLQARILELALYDDAIKLIEELLAENDVRGKPIQHELWTAQLNEALNKAA